MKIKLHKLKKGKESKWFAWCLLLMTDLKKDALESIKEEKLSFEGAGSFELNGETYVLGIMEGEGFPANMKKEINKKHIEMRKECLDDSIKVEMNYELYNK